MQWSVRMGRLFGIQFRIHLTFFLLIIFIFASVLQQKGLYLAVMAALFICAIFVCVLIHEVGHSLIARRFGKVARSITLLPIGGVAAMEDLPEKPAQEIAISIIGPFINLLIAAFIYLLVGRWTGISLPDLYPQSAADFLAGLIGVNIMLAVFNMIPAFPMDGGRVLRAILATKMDYIRATSAAVFIGQTLATLFIFFGLFFNLWLALIGVFLYIGAGSEKQHVILRSFLRQVPASAAMTTDLRTIRSDLPLAAVLEQFHHGCQDDFPVVGDGVFEGILTRDRILASIHSKGLDVSISELMDRDFIKVGPQTPLDEIYHKLLASKKTTVAVVEGDNILGLVSLDGISRYFMVGAALRKLNSTKNSS